MVEKIRTKRSECVQLPQKEVNSVIYKRKSEAIDTTNRGREPEKEGDGVKSLSGREEKEKRGEKAGNASSPRGGNCGVNRGQHARYHVTRNTRNQMRERQALK